VRVDTSKEYVQRSEGALAYAQEQAGRSAYDAAHLSMTEALVNATLALVALKHEMRDHDEHDDPPDPRYAVGQPDWTLKNEDFRCEETATIDGRLRYCTAPAHPADAPHVAGDGVSIVAVWGGSRG
jgi:hypothetical protein